MHEEIIAAISTPPGEGGIAVVRMSGKGTFAILRQIFSRKLDSLPSHTAHVGKILDATTDVIDEVVVLVMHEGQSFTGEDTVEIMCHGGTLVSQKILRRLLECGARPAIGGEFTLRAFRNGRIDLTQAEAIQEMIHAKSESALKAACHQLEGRLGQFIRTIQKEMTETTAIIEAWVDYPEEGLEFASLDEILTLLKSSLAKMESLMNTFHDGSRLLKGITISLIGAPNVGKSSLMNAFLGENRAIVTDIPGTTRDTLHEDLYIEGTLFRLIDTAGIRETQEIIEHEGIVRSKKSAKEADIVLLLLDISKEISQEERKLMSEFPQALIVWNKIDLPHHAPPFEGVFLSLKEKIGLESLKKTLLNKIWKEPFSGKDQILLTKERHYKAFQEAASFLKKAIQGLEENTSPEFVAFDLRLSLKALSTIIGGNVTEDILGAIFQKFCVGK